MTSESIWLELVAGIENFILINTLLSLLVFCLVAINRRRKYTSQCHPLSLTHLYAVALILPPVVSLWLVSASLLPAFWLDKSHWLKEHQTTNSFHLLNIFTAPLDPLLGYLSLTFILLTGIFIIYITARAYLRIGKIVGQLEFDTKPVPLECLKEVESISQKYGLKVGLVVSHYPFSFVWGFFSSKMVISTGLLHIMTAVELAGVLEHEAAHHLRRDNLSKWILTICRYSSVAFPLTNLLYRWWSEQVEIVCDEFAAQCINDPIDIAEALIKLKRLALNITAQLPQPIIPIGSGFCDGLADSFETRVTRLLILIDQPTGIPLKALSRSGLRFGGIIGIGFILSLIILFISSPLAIHRACEITLSIF